MRGSDIPACADLAEQLTVALHDPLPIGCSSVSIAAAALKVALRSHKPDQQAARVRAVVVVIMQLLERCAEEDVCRDICLPDCL